MCVHYLPCAHSRSMVALPQSPVLGTELWLCFHLVDMTCPLEDTQNHPSQVHMTEGAPLGFGAITAFTQSAYMTQGKSKADSRWATHHRASRDSRPAPQALACLETEGTDKERAYLQGGHLYQTSDVQSAGLCLKLLPHRQLVMEQCIPRLCRSDTNLYQFLCEPASSLTFQSNPSPLTHLPSANLHPLPYNTRSTIKAIRTMTIQWPQMCTVAKEFCLSTLLTLIQPITDKVGTELPLINNPWSSLLSVRHTLITAAS